MLRRLGGLYCTTIRLEKYSIGESNPKPNEPGLNILSSVFCTYMPRNFCTLFSDDVRQFGNTFRLLDSSTADACNPILIQDTKVLCTSTEIPNNECTVHPPISKYAAILVVEAGITI